MQDMVPLLDMQAPPEKMMSRQQLITKVSISILVMSLPVLYVSFLRVPPATLFRDTTFWFLMSNSIIVVIAADSGILFFASSSSSSSSSYVVDDRPFFVVSGDASMADELLPVVIVNDDDPCSQALVVARDHGDALVAVNGRAHPHALVVEGGEGGVDEPAASGEMVMSIYPPSFALASAGDADGATVQARLTASKSVAREERAWRRRSRSHSHHALVAVPPVQDKSVVVREEKLRRTATEGRHRPATAAAEEESEYARLSDEELNRRVEDFITRFNREIRLQIEKEQA